jgi:hypothetical protein
MEKQTKFFLSLAISFIAPISAIAHPGHGHESPLSPGHYIANPEHFIPMALTLGVSLIAILAYRYFSIRSKQKK